MCMYVSVCLLNNTLANTTHVVCDIPRHLGVVLYEYLGEEYPEVLGSILGALKCKFIYMYVLILFKHCSMSLVWFFTSHCECNWDG